MREKELRLALICYGGISLAVYMHGITKEIWRLARASQALHSSKRPGGGSQGVYGMLLEEIQNNAGMRLSVLVDIIAGASAGGINGVFLAQAIATGQSLDPLTDLWLEDADIDKLLDPDARPLSRISKVWAVPIAWMASGRSEGAIEDSIDPDTRDEVRRKLANFVRARWFAPPFGGTTFTNMLLDAFDAMAATRPEHPLLPPGQPLDLFVTVTDFNGHPERLRLNSPPEVVETEHRLTLSFSDGGDRSRGLGDAAELVFASRATASFPGAFPPFTVTELDQALEKRERDWPGREAFLKRVLPRHSAAGIVDRTVLIDGSVLANAPFRPAMEALKSRPARREVDRRFVYIDPKPGIHSVRLTGGNEKEAAPGFFTTIFGALSDIPREQPIRDNLDAIAGRSARILRTRRIVDSLRAEVEGAIQSLFGRTLFLDRPTPSRLAAWRSKAQTAAAKQAGHAYAAYGHLKLSVIVEELAALLHSLPDPADRIDLESVRRALWSLVQDSDLDRISGSAGATDSAIQFFRTHDLGFRIRRLRFLARRLVEIGNNSEAPVMAVDDMLRAIYRSLSLYLDREIADFYSSPVAEAAAAVEKDASKALEQLAEARDLKQVDALADTYIAESLAELPKAERRAMLLAYLGYPFYDVATLPLLQGEGLGEFDPIKVDRISPNDATSIREGGAEATLKGIRFNSFGAFFSRAYRENDYLWGRLHGADRLIDIVVSAMAPGQSLAPGTVAHLKNEAFRAILDEEQSRLTAIPELFDELRGEIG